MRRAPAIIVVALLLAFTGAAHGAATHGVSLFGDLKYGPDFAHFDYVDPDAPKPRYVGLLNFGAHTPRSFVPNREAIRRFIRSAIRHRDDQGHDSRTSSHITPEDRQAPPRHLQARALAKGGPEPSSSVLHHLI